MGNYKIENGREEAKEFQVSHNFSAPYLLGPNQFPKFDTSIRQKVLLLKGVNSY